MATPVSRPRSKGSGLGDALELGGAIVGGYYGAKSGGVQGGMAGAAGGGALGRQVGGMVDPEEPQQGVSSAAQRRMEPQAEPLPEVEDPERAIRDAQLALGNLPQAVQQDLGPALMMGQRAFQKRREAQV